MTSTTAGAGRLPRAAWVSLGVALLWSVALLVAATVAPAYQTVTETDSGTVTHGTATLVSQNGFGVLLVMAVPLLVTVLVGLALRSRGARRGAGPIAWTLTGLLAALNLLAMLSVGLFMLPVTACLAVACAIRRGAPRADTLGAPRPS